jgi:hypothetical protein
MEYDDLSADDKKFMMNKLEGMCRKEGEHLILEQGISLGTVQRISRRGCCLGPHQWYYLLTHDVFGAYDSSLNQLRASCSVAYCMSHWTLHYVKGKDRKFRFEDLTRDDYIMFEKMLEEKSKKDPETGCELWQDQIDKITKYGKVNAYRRHWDVHRFAWQIRNGETLPENVVVRHSCANKHCLAKAHLSTGTQADNVQDMVRDGKVQQGQDHRWAKYTDVEIERLKTLVSVTRKDDSIGKLAKETGVSCSLLHSLRTHGTRPKKRKRAEKRKPKLQPEEIRQIRKLTKTETYSTIAEKFRVGKTLIGDIAINKAYTNVKDNDEEQKVFDKQQWDLAVEKGKQRLLKMVKKTSSGCWIYSGKPDIRGYGNVKWKGKSYGAHRLSYILFQNDGKPMPPSVMVRHKRNEPKLCINSDHLEPGSSKQNAQDRIRDGTTWGSGEKAPGSKFSDKFREEIIDMLRTHRPVEVYEKYKEQLTYHQVNSISSYAKSKGVL